ncbi:MAG: PKD domain-containing protein [Bacteroidia bacterium]
MKTTTKIKKRSGLLRLILIFALLLCGIGAQAQCTANFFATDSSGTTVFINTSTGSGLTSTWNFGDGSTGTSSGDTFHTYGASGVYYACLTVTDFSGTCTASFCDTVSVNYGTSGGCLGIVNPYYTWNETTGTIDFYNTPSTTATGQVYHWDFGDGTISSTVGNTSHTYPYNGNYWVCLTVYETGTGTDSCQFCDNISVSSIPAPCYAYFGDSISGATVDFHNASSTPSGPLTYAWNFGDGSTSTAANPSHYYSTPGTYTVCLSIANFLGTCSDTFCDTITISTGSSGVCLGIVNANYTAVDSVGYGVFSNTPTGASGQVYYWDFGDGTNSSAMGNTTHYYSSPGTYLVCLTVYGYSGSTNDSCQYCNYITIAAPPSCSAYFGVLQDSTNIYNYFVYNYAGALPGVTTYLWDFGDGSTSTAAYPSHTYATTTPVNLCLTITNMYMGYSCTSNYCDTITPGLAMSGPFTVNVLNPAMGISETTVLSGFENYPNPFSESTTIAYSISKDANVSVTVVDLLGNTIAQLEDTRHAAGAYTLVWNAGETAEGMYMLQLKVDNTVSTRKLLINR